MRRAIWLWLLIATVSAAFAQAPRPPEPVFSAIGFSSDGAISTGIKGYITVGYTGKIVGWSITADGSSPTATIDVWKIASGSTLPTVSNTIFGTKPALSTGNAIRGVCPAQCSGWTTTFTAGDIFGFKIDAVSVATKLTFVLETKR